MPETRNQQRIREILGEKEPERDNSLRGKALARAADGQTPRTLTPWEWQQWYEENGQPSGHRRQPLSACGRWWQRLKAVIIGQKY